jgi:membrane-associated phospholipid phosphatase
VSIGYYKYNILMKMNENIAKITSNVFNPFVVSILVLASLAVKATTSVDDTVRWLAITIAISVLPMLVILFILIRQRKLESFFSNPREQRNLVYIISTVIGAIDCALLWYFKIPEILAVMFTAGFIGVMAFMIINYFWKISLHTAFITATVVVLVMVYGANAAWSAIVVPLVGWSRIVLKQHNLWQVIAGGALAAVIVFTVFWGFGVLDLN